MREGSSVSGTRVGIDIVDLDHPACRDRSAGDRLMEKILTPSEREWLDGAGTDLWSVRLWGLWAAKEAAYKVGCDGSDPTLHFRPRALTCDLVIETAGEDPPGERSLVHLLGTVSGTPNVEAVSVEGESDGRFVQVVAWSPPANPRPLRGLEAGREEVSEEDRAVELASLRDAFTADEWAGVHSVASARVRLLARDRLRRVLNEREPRGEWPSAPEGGPTIEILTAGPRGRSRPHVRVDGEDRPTVDLSLSHHGRFVAWAFYVP